MNGQRPLKTKLVDGISKTRSEQNSQRLRVFNRSHYLGKFHFFNI